MEEPVAQQQPRGRQVIDVVLPTYVMKPAEDEVFYPAKVKAIADKIVKEELAGREYDEHDAKEWSLNIADAIREQVKQLHIPRYKIVVQVTVGQMKDQGVRVASRCLWDTATDNYARWVRWNSDWHTSVVGSGSCSTGEAEGECLGGAVVFLPG